MSTVNPRGKTFVATEPGEALAVRPLLGYLLAPNGQALQIRRAFADVAAGSTDAALIPAEEGMTPRILSLAMVTGGTATTVTLKSKTGEEASVAISPLFANAANGGAVLPFNEHGWFQALQAGDAVTVTTGAGSSTGLLVQFVMIPDDAFGLL